MTKLTLEQEEILSFQVKKYPCLFDKSDKGYKEKDCVGNAWEAVALCSLRLLLRSNKTKSVFFK